VASVALVSRADADDGRGWPKWLLVIGLGLLLVLPSMFTRDLWNPDEPRYMEVAREMVALDDYVVPHLGGYVYPDKPPLFFWLTAGLYRAGAGLYSGRIVSACSVVGVLLMVYLLGQRLLPAGGGLLAAAITGTTLLFLWIAKAGVIDPLLTLLTTCAMGSAWVALGGGRRRRAWWLLFYGFCGLAVLAKGPVGFFMPGFAVLVYALFNRKHVSAGGWVHAAGVALMLGIVGAWLVPAMVRGGEAYARNILFRQQAVYTVKASSHVQGPHYYVLQLPGYLYPWTVFAFLGLAGCVADWRRRGGRRASFPLLWFLGVLVFFSLIPAKRERYLMPLVPAAGLACARYFLMASREGLRWPRLHKASAVVALVPAGLVGAAGLAIPWVAPAWVDRLFGHDPELRAWATGAMTPANAAIIAVASLLLLAAVVLGWRASLVKMRPLGPVLPLTAGVLIVSLSMDLWVFPLLNPIKSGRFFAQEALPYLRQADEGYLFRRDFSGVINLYTGITRLPVLRAGTAEQERERLIQVLDSDRKVAVVADERHVRGVLGELGHRADVAVSRRIGHRGMVLIRNWGYAGVPRRPADMRSGR